MLSLGNRISFPLLTAIYHGSLMIPFSTIWISYCTLFHQGNWVTFTNTELPRLLTPRSKKCSVLRFCCFSYQFSRPGTDSRLYHYFIIKIVLFSIVEIGSFCLGCTLKTSRKSSALCNSLSLN